MPATACPSSWSAAVISSGVKTQVVGGAEVIRAGGVGDPTVVIGAVVMMGSGGVGVDDDMIEPESLDTKLVEPGILPDLLRRL